MDKTKRLTIDDMVRMEPLTKSQETAINEYDAENNLVLNGSPGTGKTFLGIYKALEDILDKRTPYNHLYIVRSIVPTRDIGFLPGNEEEKKVIYELPYVDIFNTIFGNSNAWEILKALNTASLLSTSFVRGRTFDDCIIIVDECQNLTFHELDSIITRVGENAKIVFCGDYYQSDLSKHNDRQGILKFFEILKDLKNFSTVQFTWKDIVRSGLVRDYIITKEIKGD